MIWNVRENYLITSYGDELSHGVFYELVGHKLILSLRKDKQIYTERRNGHIMISDFNFVLLCNYKSIYTDKIYKCEYIDASGNATLTNIKTSLDIIYSDNAREFWIV
ncbi:MAG: hypothetical protein M0R17_02995 [Candidatus Omnitrophica bacterium]|jgi:hypothetical protein|nr:hypothetical protein [Candidatus Omnitrophota bacterium]